MSSRRASVVVCCLLAILVSGCSDSDGGGGDPDDGRDPEAGLSINEDAVGETLEVSTVAIGSGEESTTTITIEDIETYEGGASMQSYGDQGIAVLLSIETTSDDAGPTIRGVDQDDVELADDRLTEDRPSDPSFTEIWQERRSEETSSDDPDLDESYEGWVTYVYDSEQTEAVDLLAIGDQDDSDQVTVLGDPEAEEAETQELDDTAVGEEIEVGDFTMLVTDVVDPATDDLPVGVNPRTGERVVALELEITMEGDNDLPPAVDLYVDETVQISAGSDPFFEPFDRDETRTGWVYFYVPNRDLPTEIELRSRNGNSDSDVGRIELQ